MQLGKTVRRLFVMCDEYNADHEGDRGGSGVIFASEAYFKVLNPTE